MHSAYGMAVSVSVATIYLDAFTNHCLGVKVVVEIDVEEAECLVFRGPGAAGGQILF